MTLLPEYMKEALTSMIRKERPSSRPQKKSRFLKKKQLIDMIGLKSKPEEPGGTSAMSTLKRWLVPFTGDSRRKHQADLVSESGTYQISPAERAELQNIAISSLGLSLALLAKGTTMFVVTSTTLYSLGALCTLYLTKVTFESAYQALREGRIDINCHGALFFGAAILGNLLISAGAGLWLTMWVRWLILKTEDHSTKNVANLLGALPTTVWVLSKGVEVETSLESVSPDDIVIIQAGQVVPVDGLIVDGLASIDQQMLTGEAQPMEAVPGDPVLASTLVLSGKIYVRVTKSGQETVAAHIGKVLTDTSDFKDTMRTRAESMMGPLTWPILGLSALSYPFVGLNGALGILWATPGYKMIFFGPLSMLSFLHVSSEKGILIKDGRSLELLKDIDTVVFDKTGTLTHEQPTVGRIFSYGSLSDAQLLTYAASAEHKQTHPIAQAILTAAQERNVSLLTIDDAHYEIGFGIKVHINGQMVRIGSQRFMRIEQMQIPSQAQAHEAESHQRGNSLVMIGLDDEVVGAIELTPTIRPEVNHIITELQRRGLETIIISGDHEGPTKQLATELGIDRYFSEVLPEDKATLVERLQEEGKSVCFVGDGINDSIALKKAQVSVSLRGATTAATDNAQIVFMDGTLRQLPYLLELGEDFDSNMRINFLSATIPSAVAIGGVLFLGWGALTVILLTQITSIYALYNAIQPLIAESRRSKSDREQDLPAEPQPFASPSAASLGG